jgi:leader peptidase (prepilin peptidase) / N-methyltransferase
MSLSFYFAVFIFGLAIGSFLNCAVCRLEKGESFLFGRSYCPNCKHKLCWQDLIPLFSFLALRGRCRYCKNKISFQYPLVELVTGVIFLLIFNFQFPLLSGGQAIFNELAIFNLKNLITFCYLSAVSCFLIVIFIYDLKTYLISDGAVFSAIATIMVYSIINLLFIINNFSLLFNSLISGACASLFFFIIFFISQGKWMGFGDVKLAFLLGLFLGWPKVLVALFLAFFIGAIIGVGAIMLGRKKMSSEVPFGPFLVTGTFLALFFGQEIISWYLNFLKI